MQMRHKNIENCAFSRFFGLKNTCTVHRNCIFRPISIQDVILIFGEKKRDKKTKIRVQKNA